MTILVDVRHLTQSHPSGVGHYTIQLLRALFDLDQTNHYLLFSAGRKPLEQEVLFPGHVHNHRIQCIHLPLPNKLLKLEAMLLKSPTLPQLIQQPVDLLFLPNLNYTILPQDIPTVLTIHDLSWKIFPSFYSKKMQWWHRLLRPNQQISQVTHLITPSESTKRDVEYFFQKPHSEIQVIPHGLEEKFSPHQHPSDHGIRSRYRLPKRFALFVGTLEPRKNLIATIEAMKSYRERTGDEMDFVLAGNWGWKSEALQHRLRQPDVSKWVRVLGYVRDQDRASLYRQATVTLWPSLYEGFGLPILESMACGTPVITSHTSSLPEVAGEAVLLIDPFSSVDCTSALEQLFASQKLQEQLIQKGLERAKMFSWKQTAEQTLKLFSSLVK